jgi:hypothetical protein
LSTKYKIRIKAVDGNVLTFKGVSEYKIEDGIITFTDSFNGRTKRFAVANSEIEEEGVE